MQAGSTHLKEMPFDYIDKDLLAREWNQIHDREPRA